ncbi:hypothetical protein EDD11_006057 [Mortierella claussenii]|nr:hypothetical protein EDD11_006057 [Mortierella claussenii]
MFILDDELNNTYFTDNPPDPFSFNVPLEPTFIQPSTTFNPSTTSRYVLPRNASPTIGLGQAGAAASRDHSVLSEQPLLSLDDLGWFDTPSSFKTTAASASAYSLPAISYRNDASGFDQLSLLDEVCASAFTTPYTPHFDTPDQTPLQTPLFDCVASEDLDVTSLEHLWNDVDFHSGSASSSAVAQGSRLDINHDLGLLSPVPSGASSSASPAVVDQKNEITQDHGQLSAHLQAENALLDFVLFEDIAHPSPISNPMTTPETTSLSSPPLLKQEIDADDLAMQLVALAAAGMSNHSSTISPAASPLVGDSTGINGSLFSDVDLSPSMESVSSATVTSSPLMSFDWMSTSSSSPHTFSLDLNNNHLNINSNDATSPAAFTTHASPMLPAVVGSPQLDLDLLISLYNQGQQRQSLLASLAMKTVAAAAAAAAATAGQQSTMQTTPMTTMTTTVAKDNSLKRKADEAQLTDAGSDDANAANTSGASPRQFACNQCGRAFSRLFNLNTHERTHDRSKARLFACPEKDCRKSFTRKNDLQRHQISIHGVTLVHCCAKCDKRFARKDELRQHLELKNCK